MMLKHRIFATEFAKVYPLYVQKAERKNRTKEEVDQIIRWLTGCTLAELEKRKQQKGRFMPVNTQPAVRIQRLTWRPATTRMGAFRTSAVGPAITKCNLITPLRRVLLRASPAKSAPLRRLRCPWSWAMSPLV